MRLSRLFAVLCAIHLLLAPALAAEDPLLLPVDDTPLVVRSDDGQSERAAFDIEIAANERHRSRGLMFRTDFPDDRAMLFVWPTQELRYFWMENTPRPLDIVFADDKGRIVRIARRTVPFSRTPIPSGQPARFALEINAGLAAELGIVVGDTLFHPVIHDVGSVTVQ